ncbi:MAG: excinuclease ABC subunit UvrC [Bacteroidaceae bacterium]|nr:excinuclease ABC subunit UvrC [Bacteroidaceae bacterium]
MTKEENKKRLEYLKGIVDNLPDSPGCYQYLNEKGEIIYVGKAKKLKRRVSSYFKGDQPNLKTKILVSKIRDIKYIVVRTEEDALLLENNLIKRYKPHYNILLKDDKTYPSICITKEDFPRIIKTRKRIHDGSEYFGPYSHIQTMYALLDLIKKLVHPRACTMKMTKEGVKYGNYKECLEWHIKNCLAPCTARQSQEEYLELIDEAREILNGNTKELQRKMREEMSSLAEELRFEEAAEIKKKYDLIENYCAKSEVVSNVMNNVDVFAIESDDTAAYINYMHVTKGMINQAFTFEYKKRLGESNEELLEMGIIEMRERYGSKAKEIIVPFPIDTELNGVNFFVPQRGDRYKLLKLSQLNVKEYKFDRLKQSEKLNPEQKNMRLMKEIQDDLHLEKPPFRIELFDNSNISGTDAVAACVVFEKLKPAKKEYRKYNIRTVVGPDDYASMKEIVYRRYSRAKEENTPLPDLIITDGGKGQMEVVREIVEDKLNLKIPIAGLAKDNRHRTHELLYGFPPVVIGLKQDTALFRLLTRMQDEVHRFAITFHRQKRSKRALKSELDGLNGIGPKTKTLLLSKLGSVKRIKSANLAELQLILGNKKGENLYSQLHEREASPAEQL